MVGPVVLWSVPETGDFSRPGERGCGAVPVAVGPDWLHGPTENAWEVAGTVSM